MSRLRCKNKQRLSCSNGIDLRLRLRFSKNPAEAWSRKQTEKWGGGEGILGISNKTTQGKAQVLVMSAHPLLVDQRLVIRWGFQ